MTTEPRQRPLPFDPIAEAQRQWVEHGWSDAATGMAAVTSVMRAHQIMLARVDEVLRPLGLTFARYEMLMLLLFSKTGALPLSMVGSRLQVHPASVTNVVDRLEAQGLVERAPHPSDGRGVLARITAAGRELAGRATDALNVKVFAAPGLEPERVEDLVEVLLELRRAAGDF